MTYDTWKTSNPEDEWLGPRPFFCQSGEWPRRKHCIVLNLGQCPECEWLEHKDQEDLQKDYDDERESGWSV